jgi:hypothetical protein
MCLLLSHVPPSRQPTVVLNSSQAHCTFGMHATFWHTAYELVLYIMIPCGLQPSVSQLRKDLLLPQATLHRPVTSLHILSSGDSKFL